MAQPYENMQIIQFSPCYIDNLKKFFTFQI